MPQAPAGSANPQWAFFAFMRSEAASRAHDRAKSWMESNAAKQSLLYVSNGGGDDVGVYRLPGGKAVGELTGFNAPTGTCSDQSGDVWVVDSGVSEVVEYAHGGKKPEAKLADSGALNLMGCAVDPTTGNLAVADLGGPSGGGNVVIYVGAKGSPTEYTASQLQFAYFCAYDDKGNLFIDGLNGSGQFLFFELPSGSTTLEAITLDQSVNFPGGVAWDGRYVAVGDQSYGGEHKSAIYRFSISGSSGTLEGTTVLTGSCDVLDFAVGSTAVAAPDACQNTVSFYDYPAGGSPTKTLTGFQYPVSVAVSR
ncbi:MAG TPA: hypothetical protein VFF63_08455 [Candidatus Babeliales bacterium]|nr:hypothetical protein [Candidatus Babeliales bacterium]